MTSANSISVAAGFCAILLVAACAGRSAPDAVPAACVALPGTRWLVPSGRSTRDLNVWIDEKAQDLDGWSTYGWRRLRVAMSAWNTLRLPVRLVEASSAREAEVVVRVIPTVPLADAGREGDQAGITHVASAEGMILRAQVFVAAATTFGRRFRVPDQQANLIHELGHALGLSHAVSPSAIMAPTRFATQLTAADFELARSHYARCRAAP